MLKKLFLLVISYLIYCFPSQAQSLKKLNNDTVVWQKTYNLSFADFKGKISRNKNIGGLATTGILLYSRENNGEAYFVVEAVFMKSKSFIKDSSEYALNHEQMHFNITELFARKLRQKIAKTKFAKVSNVNDKLNRIYEKIREEWERFQYQYDRETENGMNFAKQKLWNEKILLELELLLTFEGIEVYIE